MVKCSYNNLCGGLAINPDLWPGTPEDLIAWLRFKGWWIGGRGNMFAMCPTHHRRMESLA